MVRSAGASKTLSMFEIEPPDHVGEGESSGVPLIVSHLRDHHYLPVRVQSDGVWGWVLDQPAAASVDTGQNDHPTGVLRDEEMHVLPAKEELTSSRIHSPQRRSDLRKRVDVPQAGRNSMIVECSPMTGRITSPQRRLVLRDLVRRGSCRRREVGPVMESYAGAVMVGRSASVEKWFSERAFSLARGAESEEDDWLTAWGVAPKNKGMTEKKGKECESYGGRSLLVSGGVRDAGAGPGGMTVDALL